MIKLKKGDVVFYQDKKINNVNKPDNYRRYFKDYYNRELNQRIIKIQRYVKIIGPIYYLKTVYEKGK